VVKGVSAVVLSGACAATGKIAARSIVFSMIDLSFIS